MPNFLITKCENLETQEQAPIGSAVPTALSHLCLDLLVNLHEEALLLLLGLTEHGPRLLSIAGQTAEVGRNHELLRVDAPASSRFQLR